MNTSARQFSTTWLVRYTSKLALSAVHAWLDDTASQAYARARATRLREAKDPTHA
jgi:hypothetical protein